jgi:hypothetical protein
MSAGLSRQSQKQDVIFIQIIPSQETSSRRRESVKTKQRMAPTRQKMIVQAPWLERVFIMMEKVKM